MKKIVSELIIGISLFIIGILLILLPVFNDLDIKRVLVMVFAFYAVLNLIKFIINYKSKDYDGLFVCFASIISLILALVLDINKVPWYLALTLFIWIVLMSLIKLKKADYYHDRKNKIWILRIAFLIIFMISGIISIINLHRTSDTQVIIIGYFFLVNSILLIIDPIVNYIVKE